MHDRKFYEIRDQLEKGETIWILINSGKYRGSVVKAYDTKIHTLYFDDGREYEYEDLKIKVKINNRFQWMSRYSLYESDQTFESIVTKSIKDKTKSPPKDFLDREFSANDVVFLHSPTYGEILGVVNEISDKGTLIIRVAKKTNEKYNWSKDSKQGIFRVPYDRANRILIIDDPAVLLLRA